MPNGIRTCFKSVMHSCCILLCFCYVVSVLQLPILTLLHKTSHWVGQHGHGHSHQDSEDNAHAYLEHQLDLGEREHDHSHGILAKLQSFFDASNDADQQIPDSSKPSVDKHIVKHAIHFDRISDVNPKKRVLSDFLLIDSQYDKVPTPPPRA